MRRRAKWFALLLSLAAILMVVALWRGNVEEVSQRPDRTEDGAQPAGAEPPAGGASKSSSAPSAANHNDGEVANLLAQLSPTERRYFDFGLNAGMEDVALYAQVVDQYGAPVVQAEVWYCVGGRYLGAGPGCGTKRTDNEGRFAVLSRGGSATVMSITHPEIEMQFPLLYPNLVSGSDFGDSQVTFHGYRRTRDSNEPLWTDTSPEKPHVFKAWRFGVLESVRVGGDRAGRLYPDGRLYTFNFDKKQTYPDADEGVLDGHILVSCQRDPPIFSKGNLQKQKDEMTWTVTISPIDGGIQPSEDIYMNVAPESGYLPAIVFDSQTAASRPRFPGVLGDKRFFFTAKGGRVYGAMMLSINVAADRNYCSVDVVKFKLNSQGSRNLAARRRGK